MARKVQSGLITYMRTDSTRVSDAALGEVRDFISRQYGAHYLAGKGDSLSFEERRAGCARSDSSDRCRAHAGLAGTAILNHEELKLYRLIWQRSVASQMTPALFDQTTIDIQAGRFIFRATGSVQKFDGFLKIYQEGRDEKTEEDEEAERTSAAG